MARVGVVAVVAACSDIPGPSRPADTSAFVVSEPRAWVAGASASSAAAAARAGDSLIYVSLPPGTVPDGQTAAIRNLANGSSAIAEVLDGGFDPIALLAGVGDSIEVVVTDGSGAVTRVVLAVPVRRPPTIVRTVPPKGRTDVPLNSLIRVVFSEPMDPRTLTTGTVRLAGGSTVVSGQIVASADGLRVDFVPDALLAPATDYSLVVDAAAADLSGDPLGEPARVEFTTTNRTTASPVASVFLTPETMDLAAFVGDSQGLSGTVLGPGGRSLTALAADSSGSWVRGRAVTWANSNPAVARLRAGSTADSTLVEPLAPGRVTISATVDGVRGTATITVLRTTVQPEAMTLRIGDTLLVAATVTDSAGRPPNGWYVNWGGGSAAFEVTQAGPNAGRVEARNPGTALASAVIYGPRGWAGSAFVRIAVMFGGRVASVTVAPDTVRTVPGAYLRLRATLRDSSGSVTSAPLSWSSSSNLIDLNFGLQRGYPWNEAEVVTHDATGSFAITADAAGTSGAAVVINDYITVAGLSAGAGYRSICALTPAGAVYCGGEDLYGQNGFGILGHHAGPAAVIGGRLFNAISSGWAHHCALTPTGDAYCWGWNGRGQLGTSAGLPVCTTGLGGPCSPAPVLVAGGVRFAEIAAGGAHTCGLTAVGAAWCWGANYGGRIGDGTTDNTRPTPVAVAGGLSFSQISGGAEHTCALAVGGRAYCWGVNDGGQLGDGSTTGRLTPVLVAGGLTYRFIAAGEGHTCGLTAGDVVYCWGWNDQGQLGTGADSVAPGRCAGLPCSTVPLAVPGAPTFTAISSARDHSCGLTPGGAVHCWGYFDPGSYDESGADYDPVILGPTPLSGGLTYTALGQGSSVSRSCGVTTGGVAYCWRVLEDPVKLWGQR